MPVVSIIIPVYNAELYLRRCIDSVLAQSFTDFECILVDDGSTDNSSTICKEYEQKDLRIKYYYQGNSGPAMARYYGVSKAMANMVMFIDSDDWIENNAIEIFYMKYEETKADVVVNIACNHFFDGTLTVVKSRTINTMESPLIYYLMNPKGNCDKLINKKLWRNLFVPEKMPFEDFITGIQIFSKITRDRIVCIDIPVYNYWCDSTVKSLSYSDPRDINRPFDEIKKVAVFKWMEIYLSSLQINDRYLLDAAYSWLFMHHVVISYLVRSKYVTKKETRIFWKYYKKSTTIGKYKYYQKLYLIVFCHFFTFGKFLQVVYRVLRKTRKDKNE